MHIDRKQELQEQVTTGFFGFWVRKYRISYLITGVIVLMGLIAAMQIPKESSPNVEFGIILINTVYPGANPEDIDTLITNKVYKEIEGVEGINKISSTSSLGVSSIQIEVKTNAEMKDVLNDIRNKVGNVSLPSQAKTPNITSIEASGDDVFSLYLYHKHTQASRAELVERAQVIKDRLESLGSIDSIHFSTSQGTVNIGDGSDQGKYEVHIQVPHAQLESFRLSLADIASMIQGFNIDQPIGNFHIADKQYDYRISGKYQSIQDFLDTPISLGDGGTIRLGDIATVERKYTDTGISEVFADGKLHRALALTVSKKDSASIFAASREAKAELEKIFGENGLSEYGFQYSLDIAAEIIKDYNDLFREALNTLMLVFAAMFLFIGLRDSIFATLTLPLAFLSTFIILNNGGYSMNFLTNFSLILSFGIAIDTIIVIVQAASMKLRIGYDPKTAIALALREYAIPIISGVSTTIVVFIPMMVLPGIMGKFLAYIPVTIFGVLASGLIFALTINSALYLLMVRPKKTYIENDGLLEYASREEKELLALERIGKAPITEEKVGIRTRILFALIQRYRKTLSYFLSKAYLRKIAIFSPLVFFMFGIMFLMPRLGFELFPADDNNIMTFSITGPVGTHTESMHAMIGDLTPIFANIPEIDRTSVVTTGNQVSGTIELIDKNTRKSLGQRDLFTLEAIIADRLKPLLSKGLKVSTDTLSQGPPSTGGAVGINLTAEKSSDLAELIRISKEFESHIRSLPYTKNITSSAQDTPGQFIIRLKKDLAAQKGISPAMIYGTIAQEANGITVGSLEDHGKDMDIILKNTKFDGDISPEYIQDIPLTVGKSTYRLGEFLDIVPQNAIQSIARKNGNITISVGADLLEGGDSIALTEQILKYASTYPFPKGISYSSGGENTENADLIISMITAFLLSMIVIFAILTLQFDSYSQPLIVFYSVIMALPFVMLGLLMTSNPFSLMFMIGFTAFMGVAVNHGIILIDAINQNRKKGMAPMDALVEAGTSRLEPMLLTTVTTVLGMLPIALKDKFWGGMGYTIIFGLMATTIITLFVVKSLYYELYMKEKKPRRWTRILPWKWTIWKRFMRQDTSMKQARESHRAQTLKQHTEKSVQSLIDTPEK